MLKRAVEEQEARDAEDQSKRIKRPKMIMDIESDYGPDSIQEALKKALAVPPVSQLYGEDPTEKPRSTRAPNNPWYNRHRR